MTKTETLAYRWLIRQGYSAAAITFQQRKSPDFITRDGKGWEVKLLRDNNITFTERQTQTMRDYPNVTVLLWKAGAETPADQAPFTELTFPGYWHQYRIGVWDANKDNWPKNERITIRLTPQTLAKARELWRQTFPQHGLGWADWLMSRVFRP